MHNHSVEQPSNPTASHVSRRLTQLDGLRGLAIVLVIFTHARLSPIFEVVPTPVKLLLSMLANNGGVGVAILFILSGYLMMSLYATVPSVLDFWQKRYTRIFPAFLTMTVVLALMRSWWQIVSWWQILAIWWTIVVVAGLIWKLLRVSPLRLELGKWIFRGFLAVQVLLVVGYIAFQNIVPAAVFMQVWPIWIQRLVGWLVNASMSLPFGTYISQLDGVYWSVCAEIVFYLLYPRVFLPLCMAVVKRKSWLLSSITLVATSLFLYGLQQVAKGIWGLQLLQIHLALFFVLGMVASQFERSAFGQRLTEWLQKLPQGLIGSLAFAAAVGSPLVWRLITLPSGVDSMVWAIPLIMMFFVTLTQRNWWKRLLESKILVMLGTVSYALYLTHTLALEMFVRTGEPKTVLQALLTLSMSLVVVGISAALVHIMLERPYTHDKIVTPKKTQPIIKETSLRKSARIAAVTMVFGVLLAIWQANRVPVSPLAVVHNHFDAQLSAKTLIEYQRPVTISFTGANNQLGMVMIHLKPLSESEQLALGSMQRGGETLAALRVTVRSGNQVIQESAYPLYQIYQARFFMVGIPIQSNSANQQYVIELEISDPLANTSLALINEDVTVRSVYFLPKQTYYQQPKALFELVWGKLTQPFFELAAMSQLLFVSPVLLLLVWLTWFGQRIDSNK